MVAAVVAVALAGCAADAPPPPPFDPAAYDADTERWRGLRREAIAGADGWTTLTGLHWLDTPRPLTIGADAANDIRLPTGHAPARVGTLLPEGSGWRFTAAVGAAVFHDGTPVAAMALASDRGGAPTLLRTGSVSWLLIERGGRTALRVRDSLHPERLGFRGLAYFPVDPAWRVAARLVPHRTPATVHVINVLGQDEAYRSPGVLVFAQGDRTHRLVAAQEPGATELFVIFRDSTSRDATYPAGRYLYADPPGPDGITVLDFNRAFNPPCAFTALATCPLPPASNVLPVAIRAGERRYDGPHGGVDPATVH